MLKSVVEAIFRDHSSLEHYYTEVLLEKDSLGIPTIEEAKQDFRAALDAAILGL